MRHAPLIALALPALLLSACGRQEAVDQLPNSEAVAEAANAAANAVAAAKEDVAAAELRHYTNAAHGFAIILPEGWVKDAGAASEDGVAYKDPGAGANIRVFWNRADGNRDLHQIVAGINQGKEAVDDNFVSDREYRGTSNDSHGNNVALRVLRKADGSLVTATFTYPEMLSEQYQAISDEALDSLKLLGEKQPADTNPADNAADPT